MLWGNGDSSKLTETERETLSELRRLVETGHIVSLSPEQSRVALEAVQFYAGARAAGGLFMTVRNALVIIGSTLFAWWAFQDEIILWFKGALT